MLKRLIDRLTGNETGGVVPRTEESPDLVSSNQFLINLKNDRVKELKAWRDVGQSFVYLGKEMVVCRHSRLEMNGHFCQVIPEVQARYVDNHGVIHTIAISEKEALTLAKSEA